MTTNIYLGLGSNLGDRAAYLKKAIELLALPVVAKSSLYETEPLEFREQPWFLNAVIQIETAESPLDLLRRCQSVESSLNRVRNIPKGPRTIDIDLLFYGQQILRQPELTIPHPALAQRKFVLLPLSEIARNFTHPVLQRSIADLLHACTDNSVVRMHEPQW